MKEEEKQSQKMVPMKGKKVEKMLKKRWIYPAVYLAFAAVILTSVLWYQSDAKKEKNAEPQSSVQSNQNAVPVTLAKEVFQMPVADSENVSVVRDFYSSSATADEQAAALVYYNHIYYMNRGIDLAAKNNQSFDVTAALSGTVIKAAKDPELGFVVEVKHDKGIVTHYSSLASLAVKVGESVKQGEVLGKAGQNVFDKDSKIHAHFEVRKDGQAIDPVSVWNQSLAQVATSFDKARAEAQNKNAQSASKQKASDNQAQQSNSSDQSSADPSSTDDSGANQ